MSDLLLLAFVVVVMVLLGIELGRNVVASLDRASTPAAMVPEE